MSYPKERMITCFCYLSSSVWTSVLQHSLRFRDGIVASDYTYYCSGRSDGYHAQGVAVAVSNKVTPMIIEITPVNERIMR